MSLETALRELGKEIQADERFAALKAAAAANDADETLQNQMHEMQLLSLQYQQEAEKGEEASQDKIKELQNKYQDLYNTVMDGENCRCRDGANGSIYQPDDWLVLRRSGSRNMPSSAGRCKLHTRLQHLRRLPLILKNLRQAITALPADGSLI